MQKVIIVGGGFAGITLAQELGGKKDFHVTLIDRRNYHLFQPLLYQVAMAGLNPSDISIPLRKLLSRHKNIDVVMAEVDQLNLGQQQIRFDQRWVHYDKLVLCCGAKHFYFGNPAWEEQAPGLKNIEQATEIRRRILMAFELAEKEENEELRQEFLTFAVVGGGPTGVELAGAIREMVTHTLYKDYKKADLGKTRVLLVETGPRVLAGFSEKLSQKTKDVLEKIGVEVLTHSRASDLSSEGLKINDQFVKARTILWAAGVKPSQLTEQIPGEKDRSGRVYVQPDLSLPEFPNVYVLGDQAAFKDKQGQILPGLAPVAIQQAKALAKNWRRQLRGQPTEAFEYFDKGIMATIGRTQAVVQVGNLQFSGILAWLTWVFIHVAYLMKFKNRFFVFLQWTWSYFSFGRGARLIVHKTWRFYSGEKIPIDPRR